MVDPLGAYTPEADSALDEAKTAVHQAKNLRKEAAQVMLRIDEVQKTATRAVNDLLTRKIAETTCLSVSDIIIYTLLLHTHSCLLCAA